jgi:hypothetical protein
MLAKRQGNQFLGGLVLAVLFCIFIGYFAHIVPVMIIGFVCIPIGLLFVFISQSIGLGKANEALESFSKLKTGLPPIKKCPTELTIPPIFRVRGHLVQIPFSHITNIIKINADFMIFYNSYWSHPRPGENVREKQLTFLFSITPVIGYHRIVLKNKIVELSFRIDSAMVKAFTSKEIPVVEVSDPDIRDSYLILSPNETEAVRIVSLINRTLKELSGICITRIFIEIDRVPTNLEIHITDRYVLARMNPQLGEKIESLYSLFRDMQRALA